MPPLRGDGRGAQEFCVECGLRLPGPERFGPLPTETRSLRLRVVGLAAVAVAGAVTAIAIAADGDGAERILTATGGSVTAPTRAVEPQSRLVVWPRAQTGWTIVLVSMPKASGRDEAVGDRPACAHAASAPRRRPRLLPLREPPTRVLDDVHRAVPERGGRDRLAPSRPRRGEGRARPADRAVACSPCGIRRTPHRSSPTRHTSPIHCLE